MKCSYCQNLVYDSAKVCHHCGQALASKNDYDSSRKKLHSVSTRLNGSERIKVKSGLFKRFSWFILVNAAVLISFGIISQGAFYQFAPFFFIYAFTFPLIALSLSRWIAKRTYRMKIIKSDSYLNQNEASLYHLIDSLSKKAGIGKIPQIGIYNSDEINAFATGFSKNRSLVAFSTGLLEEMSEESIAAVAAHEIAHIANGDMVTLTLVQSVVNLIILILLFPLNFIRWSIDSYMGESGSFLSILTFVAHIILNIILVFLGSLVVKAFSRRREFQADKLAAELVNPTAMINALRFLKNENPVVLQHEQSYIAFKINAPARWLDIFSTHPSLDRRISALQKVYQEMAERNN